MRGNVVCLAPGQDYGAFEVLTVLARFVHSQQVGRTCFAIIVTNKFQKVSHVRRGPIIGLRLLCYFIFLDKLFVLKT